MLVVDDFFADIDRSAIEFQRFLHRNHCTINAGAISARRG
jgi:hypothetical protein